jgi:hypothetical protein
MPSKPDYLMMKSQHFMRSRSYFPGLILSALVGISASAGEWFVDFESDPAEAFAHIETTQPDVVWGRSESNPWGATGNESNGFLSLTEATPETSTIAVLPDVLEGQIAKTFTLTMDLRVGNGTSDRPANGFSLNFARPSDPMLSDVEAGSIHPDHAAIGGAVETGTQTGLVISFDTWEGDTLPDDSDMEGILVRLDNATVGRFPFPTRHGNADDTNSLQTGPVGGSDAAQDVERGDPNVLKWRSLEVTVDAFGMLDLTYKGQKVIDQFSSGFFPSPWQCILMGRTSEANENHHIDNLKLVTEWADHWLIANLVPRPMGFTLVFRDIGSSQVDPDSVEILLDGTDISAGLETYKIDELTYVFWESDTRFESGSSHEIQLTATDLEGEISSMELVFDAPDYTMVPANFVLEKVDVSKSGFLLSIKQSESALESNTEARLAHLADGSNNVADATGARDFTWIVDLINFDQDGSPQGIFHDYGDASPYDVPDDFIPGIPGLTDSKDNITGFIQTVVRIPEAGFYTFGFNSSDGFLATVGTDIDSQGFLGEFSGRRAGASTLYRVYFEKAGDYAMKSLWYGGDSQANFEWFTLEPNVALLNDTDHGGLQTFAVQPRIPERVISLMPRRGATGVIPISNVEAVIKDGDHTVDADSISLTLDGNDVDETVRKSGDLTTVTLDRQGKLWAPGQIVTVALNYAAGGDTFASNWSFTVEDYPTLTKSVTEVGSGDEAGFEFRIIQTADNLVSGGDEAEDLLAGPRVDNDDNLADPAGGMVSVDTLRPGIIFHIDGVINMDQDRDDEGVFRQSGEGSSTDRDDSFIPGIPGLDGSTDHMAAEILTYIEFPTAGYFQMIFNSDEGFRVTEDHGSGDAVGVLLGEFDGLRLAADTVFGFAVIRPGVYPLRAIWYGGDSEASLEWSSLVGDGRYLINDSDAEALKAFRTRTGNPVDIEMDGGEGGAIISVGLSGGQVIIEYTGILKSSDSITGSFNAVDGATSPYSVAPTKAAEFYIAE